MFQCYLDFVSLRASGKLKTTANWMRNFVTTHPDYKKDSVVSDKITFDLTVLADDIVQGRHHGNALNHITNITENIKIQLYCQGEKTASEELRMFYILINLLCNMILFFIISLIKLLLLSISRACQSCTYLFIINNIKIPKTFVIANKYETNFNLFGILLLMKKQGWHFTVLCNQSTRWISATPWFP